MSAIHTVDFLCGGGETLALCCSGKTTDTNAEKFKGPPRIDHVLNNSVKFLEMICLNEKIDDTLMSVW